VFDRLAGWLAGCLAACLDSCFALFKTDRADLRQPTVSFSFFSSSLVLSFTFTTLYPKLFSFLLLLSLSLSRTRARSPSLCLSLSPLLASLPCLCLCLSVSCRFPLSSCLMLGNKHSGTVQEQFILFISSSFSSTTQRR
jgi:hypothetical protein